MTGEDQSMRMKAVRLMLPNGRCHARRDATVLTYNRPPPMAFQLIPHLRGELAKLSRELRIQVQHARQMLAGCD
jgi:hypothetical protein